MLSMPHLIVLFVIALIVLGPEKLPEVARMLGKATAEMRKMTSDFRYTLESEVRELDRQARIQQEQLALENTTQVVGNIQGEAHAPSLGDVMAQAAEAAPEHEAANPHSEEVPVVKSPDEKAPDDAHSV
jgi:Tat protein translocase TatB subunit